MDSDNNYSELISRLKSLGFNEGQIRTAVYATGASPSLTDANLNTLVDYMTRGQGFRASHKQLGQPIQLVKPHDEYGSDEGGFELNYDALERIFGSRDVKNKHVAIYSLTGAFRKGKSFLLNLFLHRLRSNKPKEWLDDGSQILEPENGFHWRGGYESDTKGIWIWNKPFPLTDSNGKEVMLFLMDTQGAFDLVADTKCSSVIFALSTLIGSVQIYNVLQQIQSDDLQNLHLFANYGKTAKQEFAKDTRTRNQIPFQKLMFLVRDWPVRDVELGHSGGSSYLKKILHRSRNKEIVEIRENMEKYFTDLSCFLLPYPGRVVAERGKKCDAIQFKEIDSNFLKYADKLQHLLFDPANIVVKQNNGCDVTGRDLINLVASYFKIFESGKMPHVDSILEANKKAAIVTLIQMGKQTYSQNMNMLCTGYTENLASFHRESKEEALSVFDQSPKLGDREFIGSKRAVLEDLINQQLEFFEEKNKTFYERLKNELRDIVDGMAENFKSKLQQECGLEYVEEKVLRNTFDRICKQVLGEFREKAKDYNPQLRDKYEQRLNQEFGRLFDSFKETNLHRKFELERKLSELAVRCKTQYNDCMNEIKHSAVDDMRFEQTHSLAYETSLTQFESSQIGQRTELRADYKGMLGNELSNEKTKFENINNTNKKLQKAKTLEVMVKAKEKYSNLMKTECGDAYVEESKLNQAHDKSVAKCLELFDKLGKDPTVARKCKQQFTDDVAGNLLEGFKRQNQTNKVKEVNWLKEIKERIFNSYEQDMKMNIGNSFKETAALERLHQEKKRKALGKYERETEKGSVAQREKITHDLEEDIDRCYSNFVLQNSVFERAAREDADADLQEIKNVYFQQMNELTDNRYVEPSQLQQVHETTKQRLESEIVEELRRKGYAQLGKEYAQKCCHALDGCYDIISANNEKNKPHWFTKVGKGLTQGLVQGAAGFALGPPGGLRFITGAIGFAKGFMEGIKD